MRSLTWCSKVGEKVGRWVCGKKKFEKCAVNIGKTRSPGKMLNYTAFLRSMSATLSRTEPLP